LSEQQWIDFKKLRERLDFRAVLRHYGVELKPKGRDQLSGFCPLPGHNGQRRSPSFGVNLARRIFHCFGCQRGGNALEFCCLMEGKSPANRHDLREVAATVQDRFGLGDSDRPPAREGDRSARPRSPSHPRPSPPPPESDDTANERTTERVSTRPATIVNAPLDFELKGLDPHHPYLRERGFSDATIAHFGLGFCNRGLMRGRVVIPLKNSEGKRIGYAGRFTRDDQVCEAVPKYLFPGDRERNGAVLSFRKSVFLYNGHAIEAPVRDLYVVEGFASVWWLHQCGFHDSVALMGSSCSPEQAELIRALVHPAGRVWLMPDSGVAGERCADSLLRQVAPHRLTRWVKLDAGQPTDLSPADLRRLLEWRAAP